MNILKKLITVATLAVGLVFNSQAATVTVNAGSNLIQIVQATGAWNITGITVAGGTGAASFSIYDHNTNYLTYTNAAYSSRGYYTTNISTIFTNNQGIIQTNVSPGIFTYSNYVASASNAVPAQWSGAVAAGGAAGYSTQIICEKGVVVQATTNCTITITYTSPY